VDSDSSGMGRYGSIWVAQTSAYTAPTGTFFSAFTFLSATVFATLTMYNAGMASASSALVSMTFAAGQTIYGMWTTFQLQSGAMVAYKVSSKDFAHG
jgi:hypothetical protein